MTIDPGRSIATSSASREVPAECKAQRPPRRPDELTAVYGVWLKSSRVLGEHAMQLTRRPRRSGQDYERPQQEAPQTPTRRNRMVGWSSVQVSCRRREPVTVLIEQERILTLLPITPFVRPRPEV